MFSIETIYLLGSMAAVAAMAPQVKTLLTTRSSAELSLLSWCIWSGSQIIAFAYSISLGALPFIVISGVWVVYYLLIVTLIIRFRKSAKKVAEPATMTLGETKISL